MFFQYRTKAILELLDVIPLPLLPTSVQTASRRDKEDDRSVVKDEVKEEIGVDSDEIQEAETAVMKAMRVSHSSNGLMSVLTHRRKSRNRLARWSN